MAALDSGIVKDVVAGAIEGIGELIEGWIHAGDTTAIEALQRVVDRPDVLKRLDEALILAQTAKAAAALPP